MPAALRGATGYFSFRPSRRRSIESRLPEMALRDTSRQREFKSAFEANRIQPRNRRLPRPEAGDERSKSRRGTTLATSPIAYGLSLLSRLVQKLLEQPAQFERRALAAVRHHGRCNVARAIELPLANRHAAQSWIALRTALSLLASDPALALARQELPAGTRAGTRRIPERDEATAVESNDVETTIICALVERAAHGDALTVAAGGGEADPVGVRRRLPGVALRLERAAIIGDDVALVVNPLGHPQLNERQLARRSLLAPRAWLPCSLLFNLVLKVRDSLRQNIHNELVLSGDSLPDALVDIVKRDLRRVQLALARPFLLANVAHYRMPRATTHITITRIMARGLSM